jgi:hypothetical protein
MSALFENEAEREGGMSASVQHLNAVSAVSVLHKEQIKIVKQKDVAVKSRRYDELLKQADYLEAQANRLAKMAREMRLLILTTE